MPSGRFPGMRASQGQRLSQPRLRCGVNLNLSVVGGFQALAYKPWSTGRGTPSAVKTCVPSVAPASVAPTSNSRAIPQLHLGSCTLAVVGGFQDLAHKHWSTGSCTASAVWTCLLSVAPAPASVAPSSNSRAIPQLHPGSCRIVVVGLLSSVN